MAEQNNGMAHTTEPSGSVVRFAPMHNQILPQLRRDIVENRWKSGARLSEPLLCKQFGVSRTPLREALKTLEAEGLVRLVPHVGAVVTDPSPTEIAETMEILIGLEQLRSIDAEQFDADPGGAFQIGCARLHIGREAHPGRIFAGLSEYANLQIVA